jgi:RHS repeat-associated protein
MPAFAQHLKEDLQNRAANDDDINGGSGTRTKYLYDGGALVAEYVNGTMTQRFVHGSAGDEPLVWFQGSGTTNPTFLHADERGSIITASNASGVASTSVKYGPYGESGALAAPFGYTGQLYIPDIQLYYYKARMYAPQAARFLQPDPIEYEGGTNVYSYVGGDPVNFLDIMGTEASNSNCPGGPCLEETIAEVTVTATYYCDWICRWNQMQQGLQNLYNMSLQQLLNQLSEFALVTFLNSSPTDGGSGSDSSRKACTFSAKFSAVGPRQARGIGALGFKPPNDSVAVNPGIFGLPYGTYTERAATQAMLRANVPYIRVSAPQLANFLSGGTTFTIGDVGDANIRNSGTPRFDIYRFATKSDALDFGLQTADVTVSGVPKAWLCPGGGK